MAQKKCGYLSVYVSGSNAHTIEEITRLIFEGILKETSKSSWFDRIKGLFGDNVAQIDLFGVALEFRPPPDKLKGLTGRFSEAISEIYNSIQPEQKGIFIILDDLDGLTKTSDFALWFKSFVDSTAIHFKNLPLCIMIIGVPEVRKELSDHQPSILRIFQVVEIEKLSNEEVSDFFIKTFKTKEISIEAPALKSMVLFSSGLPNIMQEIGSSVFRVIEKPILTLKEVHRGLSDATDIIGKKYLHPKVYDTLRSPRYFSILSKISAVEFHAPFKKSDVEKNLTDAERKIFHNFLRKMKELGVIVPVHELGSGYYRYVNHLYPVYIDIKSQEQKTQELK